MVEYKRLQWRILGDDFVNRIVNEADYLIMGVPQDDRDYIAPNQREGKDNVSIIYDPEVESLTCQGTIGGKDYHNVYDDPVEGVRKFVATIPPKSILAIDITSLSVQSLFILLLELANRDDLNLFCIYIAPDSYNIGTDQSIVPSYSLVSSINTVKGIPGFVRMQDQDRIQILFVTMGFEGGRFFQIREYFQNDRNLRPILPLPSYRAGWHEIALKGNIQTLVETTSVGMVIRAAAMDPFEVYTNLGNWYDTNNQGKQIVLAPIGTKPHALGMALLALKYRDAIITYDHPIPKKMRTYKAYKFWGYCITGLLT